MLIASGRYDDAEQLIEQSLRRFNLFRPAKLLTLHHLAALRHAQRRFAESATLCRAILRQRSKSIGPLARPTRLMLAEALLEQGDLGGAYATLMTLYAGPSTRPDGGPAGRMGLNEAMQLALSCSWITNRESGPGRR